MHYNQCQIDELIERHEMRASYLASTVHFMYSLPNYEIFIFSANLGRIDATYEYTPDQEEKESLYAEIWNQVFDQSDPKTPNAIINSYALLFYHIDRFSSHKLGQTKFGNNRNSTTKQNLSVNGIVLCPKNGPFKNLENNDTCQNKHQIKLVKVENWQIHDAAFFATAPIAYGNLLNFFCGIELIHLKKAIYIDDPLTLDDLNLTQQPLGKVCNEKHSNDGGEVQTDASLS